jgi:hypothetical protein
VIKEDMKRIELYLTVFLLFGGLALVSCSKGEGLVGVSGKVTLDGAPLPKCRVVFYQSDAGPEKNFMAITDAEGNYTLETLKREHEGAAPGKYQVTLSTAFATLEMIETDPIPPEKVPPQFRETEFEIPIGGTTSADFGLTSR